KQGHCRRQFRDACGNSALIHDPVCSDFFNNSEATMASVFEEVKKFGKKINIDKVVKSAAENYGWDSDRASYAKEWYMKYLYLCYKYPDRYIAAISKDADSLWHQHIIDTQKYRSDCDLLFDKFLDHQPIYGKPSRDENR